METEKIKCPGCGHEMLAEIHEFVDVTTDPDYKEKIMDGSFFLNRCPECGDETMAEYPFLYMDPSRKLNIYMAPGEAAAMQKQLNSLELPDAEADAESVFRVVDNGAELLEKILIFEGGRDDRIMELYKTLVFENIKDEWPHIQREDLLYFKEETEDYLIVWDYTNAAGEQLTVSIDEELYSMLDADYGSVLTVPSGKYAKVDTDWIAERVEVE